MIYSSTAVDVADCIDASLSIWSLGGCSDINSFQSQCNLQFHLYSKIACQFQILIIFNTMFGHWPQIHRTDYLNGGTALHFAAIKGHTRCIRLLLADYVPSISIFLKMMRSKSKRESSFPDYDKRYI